MNRKLILRICAIVCGLSGVVILLWIFSPILIYEFTSPPLETFISPVSNSNIAGSANTDYTKASNWFPGAKVSPNFQAPTVSFYKISIPRLGIRSATVSIGGEDLAQSLIQYPGTAVPGKIGNSVIFGHSVLPSFFDPANYLTIFSTLPTLVNGDIITLDYDGITYKYQVEEKFEVDPADIQILDQDQSDSFLSLVTCVPPGLQTRRLIIKARIVPIRGGDNGISGT